MTVDEQQQLSDEDFLKRAFDAVGREVGVSGLARFLHLTQPKDGDYTRERHLWLGDRTGDVPAKAESHTRAA